MKITRTETRKVEIVADVTCDRCGASMRGRTDNINGLRAYVTGAYDGTHIPDGAEWEFDACEKCLKEWLDTFKVKPWEGDAA